MSARECSRDGCTYVAERTIQRTDTNETALVCLSCARFLVDTTDELVFWDGGLVRA